MLATIMHRQPCDSRYWET